MQAIQPAPRRRLLLLLPGAATQEIRWRQCSIPGQLVLTVPVVQEVPVAPVALAVQAVPAVQAVLVVLPALPVLVVQGAPWVLVVLWVPAVQWALVGT